MLLLSLVSPVGYHQLGSTHARCTTARSTNVRSLLGLAQPGAVNEGQYGSMETPYKEAAYDPEAADAFFRARPVATLTRLFQLTQLSGSFIASTVLDKKLGREEEMVEQAGGAGWWRG